MPSACGASRPLGGAGSGAVPLYRTTCGCPAAARRPEARVRVELIPSPTRIQKDGRSDSERVSGQRPDEELQDHSEGGRESDGSDLRSRIWVEPRVREG